MDDVITAAALDHIGPAPTQDDVAIGEARGAPQQGGQTSNHGDASRIQHVIALGEGIRQQPAPQGVVSIPAGQALHFHKAIKKIDGQVGGQKNIDLEIGIHHLGGIGIGDPVETPGSPALVHTRRAEHDVVARLGIVVIITVTN